MVDEDTEVFIFEGKGEGRLILIFDRSRQSFDNPC
jgi:hypothetical protein